MAQPDCHGAIVHSPVAVCSDLETQRAREDDDRKEEEEEVELAEEVGEDVLMIAGDGEEVEENTGQNEPEEERIVQMPHQSNGVINEEKRGAENLKENYGEEEEPGDIDNQNTDKETNEEEGEEESNDGHTMIENPCDLLTLIDEKREEQSLDNREHRKEGDNRDKEDLIENLETDVREEKASEENGSGKNLSKNCAEEEECDDEDDQNIDEETNEKEMDSSGEEESNDRHTKTENPCDLKTVIDGEGQVQLLDNTESSKQDTEYEANKQDETDILEIQIREKKTGNTDDVCKEQELGSSTDDADYIHEPTIMQELDEGTQLFINETDKEVLHTEGEVTEIFEPPLTVVSDESKVCQPSADPDSAVPFDTAATAEVVELESEFTKENQEAKQLPLNVICSEEHSQTEITSKETLSTLINQTFQEEQLQSDDSQMVRDGQNMTEGDDAIDSVVSEPLCEEEKGEDDDKELEKEKNGEVVAHVELPNPVLQYVEERQSNIQQDADTHKSGEVFKLEEAGTGEPSSPGTEDTLGEKQCTTVEASDLQDHPLPTQSDELIRFKQNMTAQLKAKALTADRKGDNIEELMAEMEMANEPVTVLDDDFDELAEAAGTDRGQQKPASVPAEADNTLEPAKVKEHHNFQKKEIGLEEGNEEPHKPGKEKIQMNEKEVNDRDFEFILSDRVKEARECGMLNVDPQLPKMPPHWKKDDNWIKKEPEDVKEPEVKHWRKELKPVRKDIWEPEMGHQERSPEKKSLPKEEDWIKELKSVIKDESFPKKRDEQAKKKRVVLLEDGHSYFPQLEKRNENREEVKLSASAPAQDSAENQDQAYEISLYVKVKNTEPGRTARVFYTTHS